MGATQRRIIVVPYDPHWALIYERERACLCDIFGALLISIHHIGSTSVPGLRAKPIIDILPVVRDIEAVDNFNDAMAAAGYEAIGENGIPGRRYFRKGGKLHRSHHVHVYAEGNPEIERHLRFRNYLRAHTYDARRYAALKSRLAREFPHDIHGYMAGKDSLVKELIAKANLWHQNS